MKRFKYLLYLAALLLVCSCSSTKPTLTMFEDLESAGSGSMVLNDYQLKIRPQDELVITVNSTDAFASAPYNLPLVNPAPTEELLLASTPRQQSYVVDANGDINFPVLGKLHVAGMTTLQLTEMLTERISQDVKDPVVNVTLINFSVNVVGEVAKPAKIRVNNQRFSILDALASAGHMTEFGDRTNVLVIREENGKAEYHKIDLTKSDVTSSPYYYLQQNDVVMVQPTSVKESNARYDTNNAYKIQVVSAIVSGASVIASLVIALTVK